MFQATGRGSYLFANWISASIRGLYTEQGKIEGHYNDAPQSFEPAGPSVQLWRPLLGHRLRHQYRVPSGALAGLRLSAEWLQPVYDDPNGYQLERDGTLWANVSMSW